MHHREPNARTYTRNTVGALPVPSPLEEKSLEVVMMMVMMTTAVLVEAAAAAAEASPPLGRTSPQTSTPVASLFPG